MSTTTVFLVRHAPHEAQGEVLVGRAPGVALAEGCERPFGFLRAVFEGEAVDAVFVSPMDRARATARPVAEACGVSPEVLEDLCEIDFGDWTGRRVADLEGDPAFELWCRDKTVGRPPGGESLLEVQARMVRACETARAAAPDGAVVLVSHGDPLKSLIAHYVGLPLDGVDRFDLDPGSVSALCVGDWGAKLLFLNERVRS